MTEARPNDRFRTRRCRACGKNVPEAGACGCDAGVDWAPAKDTRNTHPTVKPIELMRWLVRLVTPAGGVVLDPFTGSGTTGIAAAMEGFDFVGIEREPEFHALAEARIKWWAEHAAGAESVAEVLGAERESRREREFHAAIGQEALFDA